MLGPVLSSANTSQWWHLASLRTSSDEGWALNVLVYHSCLSAARGILLVCLSQWWNPQCSFSAWPQSNPGFLQVQTWAMAEVLKQTAPPISWEAAGRNRAQKYLKLAQEMIVRVCWAGYLANGTTFLSCVYWCFLHVNLGVFRRAVCLRTPRFTCKKPYQARYSCFTVHHTKTTFSTLFNIIYVTTLSRDSGLFAAVELC